MPLEPLTLNLPFHLSLFFSNSREAVSYLRTETHVLH